MSDDERELTDDEVIEIGNRIKAALRLRFCGAEYKEYLELYISEGEHNDGIWYWTTYGIGLKGYVDDFKLFLKEMKRADSNRRSS